MQTFCLIRCLVLVLLSLHDQVRLEKPRLCCRLLDDGARSRSKAFSSPRSHRTCPVRRGVGGGGGAAEAAGGAHPATTVADVKGFFQLDLDLHGSIVQPPKESNPLDDQPWR